MIFMLTSHMTMQFDSNWSLNYVYEVVLSSQLQSIYLSFANFLISN